MIPDFEHSPYLTKIEDIIYLQASKHGCIGIYFREALAPATRAWLGIKFSGKISQHLEVRHLFGKQFKVQSS